MPTRWRAAGGVLGMATVGVALLLFVPAAPEPAPLPVARAEPASEAREAAQPEAQPAPQTGTQPLALWDVTVVDVERGELRPNMTVVIEGQRIVAVRPTATIRLGSDVRRIDLAGKYVMPGLWDAHAHLSYWGEDALGRLVAHGVTSIREMGGDPDQIEGWMASVASGEIVGPAIFWCGPFLEGPEGGDEYRLMVESPSQAREAAAALLDRGVDFLKIQPAIGADEVAAIVATARERGSYLVGHVPQGLSAIEAVDLGLRSIDHMSPYLGLTESELQATIGAFLASGTAVSPALYSMVAQVEARGGDVASNERVQRAYAVVRQFHAAGVPLLVGANFAYRDWPHAPGSALHGEMRVLVEAGVPAAEVLRLVTVGNAAFLGLESERVVVAAGATADLLLLNADPLVDIANSRQIAGVVLRGEHLDAEALAALIPAER